MRDWMMYNVGPSRYNERDLHVETEIVHEPLENALANAKKMIAAANSATEADTYRVFISGKTNYRDDIATVLPYKGNRDPDHKPKWYQEIKDYLVENHNGVMEEHIFIHQMYLG